MLLNPLLMRIECLEMLWIALGLLIALSQLPWLLLSLKQQQKLSQLIQNQNQNKLIDSLQLEKRDLLNRLMSKDLHSYVAMSQIPLQTTDLPSDPYVSMSDEAEYARHRRTEEYNPTDDVQHFMDDFGAR